MEPQYKEIVTAIIEKQKSIIGSDMAIRKSRKVTGLTVNDEGKAEGISEDPINTLESLIKEYSALSGNIAIKFSKEAAGPIAQKYPELSLPQILR